LVIRYSKTKPIKIDEKTIFKKLMIKILLKLNNFSFFKKINNINALNHDDKDVAIGIIINPICLK
tara:strand:+ start:1200 stop:1394 length:195 start_codon:yes stop_codon:yes gene_type:complete